MYPQDVSLSHLASNLTNFASGGSPSNTPSFKVWDVRGGVNTGIFFPKFVYASWFKSVINGRIGSLAKSRRSLESGRLSKAST